MNTWSTLKNAGFYLAVIDCHFQFGPIITMPLAAYMCESELGWKTTYYLQGTVSLVLFVVFVVFYRDSPAFHRDVSTKELASIQRGKSSTVSYVSSSQSGRKYSLPPPPYANIVRDKAVWGVFASDVGSLLGFQIFMQYGPIYLSKVTQQFAPCQ